MNTEILQEQLPGDGASYCPIEGNEFFILIHYMYKKKLCGPFLWMEFNCLKARSTSRR